jgi:hypothetical protein
MGETVRIHHSQQGPPSAYCDIKLVKFFGTVGLALFECYVDLCFHAPGLQGPLKGNELYQAGFSESQLPTFNEGAIISETSLEEFHVCSSLVSASDCLGGGAFNVRFNTLFGICSIGHERDDEAVEPKPCKSYISSVACFFL